VEGMNVFYLSTSDESIQGLTWEERNAITSENSFSFDLKQNLPNVKTNINYWTELMSKSKQKMETDQIEDKSTTGQECLQSPKVDP
jgi:hypothetical protein